MQKSVRELENAHEGADIWIIAAGASMNYVEPSFFDNKITIGVNRVFRKFDCDYIITKDSRGFEQIKSISSSDTKLVLSKHESGNLYQGLNHVDFEHYIFEHPPKPNEQPMLQEIKKGKHRLVVSYSTITSALHLAAVMGAKNIMICGHDCGTIDGEATITDYYGEVKPHQKTEAKYVQWLGLIEEHTIAVADTIKREFGCNVHSLNPFVNFNLEGHSYHPSRASMMLKRDLRTREDK